MTLCRGIGFVGMRGMGEPSSLKNRWPKSAIGTAGEGLLSASLVMSLGWATR